MATGLMLYVFLETEYFKYFFAFILVGWLLLLRTEESTKKGLQIYSYSRRHLDRLLSKLFKESYLVKVPKGTQVGKYPGLPRAAIAETISNYLFWPISSILKSILLVMGYGLFYLLNLVLSILSKISATLYVLFSQPRKTISAIPDNWNRYAYCIDSNHPVEFVPGYLDFCENNNIHGLDNIRWKTLKSEIEKSPFNILIAIFVILLVFNAQRIFELLEMLVLSAYEIHFVLAAISLFMAMLIVVKAISLIPLSISILFKSPIRLVVFLPAYLYRLSLKSAFIVYYPLSWFVFPFSSIDILNKRDPAIEVNRNYFEWGYLDNRQIILMISVIVSFFYISRYIKLDDQNILSWFFLRGCGSSDICSDVISLFVYPEVIPTWHIVAFVNSLLAIFVAKYSIYYYRRYGYEFNKLNILMVSVSRYLIISGFFSFFVWTANLTLAWEILTVESPSVTVGTLRNEIHPLLSLLWPS